ncbi:MAG: hypothetical protein QGG90_04595, partial [Nitrospinota bacterium]|nr:hypothetical protein [Nitrospinota bacterium]
MKSACAFLQEVIQRTELRGGGLGHGLEDNLAPVDVDPLAKGRIGRRPGYPAIGQGDGVRTIEFEFTARRVVRRPNNPNATTRWMVEAIFGLEALERAAAGGARNKQVSGLHLREAIKNAISVVLDCPSDLIRGVKISIQRYVGPAA